MKSLIVTSQDGTINYEFITDLIDDKANNFTIMEVRDLNNDGQVASVPVLGFVAQLPNSLDKFSAAAAENGHQVVLVDHQTDYDTEPNTLVPFPTTTTTTTSTSTTTTTTTTHAPTTSTTTTTTTTLG